MTSPETQSGSSKRHRPRLAVVSPALAGGVGRGRSRLIPAFVEAGVPVDLLVTDSTGPFAARAAEAARLWPLRSSHALFGMWDLVQYLRVVSPDAILTDRLRTNKLAMRARAIAGVRPRLFLSTHDNYSVGMRELRPQKRRRKRCDFRRLIPRNDGVIAVSDGVANDVAELAQVPRDRIRVIYNPVLPEEITDEIPSPPSHPWFRKKDRPVLLFAGRFEAQKDLPTLIEAFADLRARRDARLLLLGDGSQRSHLMQMVRGHGLESDVDMPGWKEDAFRYMGNCDLFVLPSRHEGLPNTLIECLALGTSVVATDCPSGPREILDGGRYGRLTQVGAPEELAAAMEQSLQHPVAGRETLRQRARDFSVERAASAYLSFMGLTARACPAVGSAPEHECSPSTRP